MSLYRFVQLVKDAMATVPQEFLYAAFDATSANGTGSVTNAAETKVNTSFPFYFPCCFALLLAVIHNKTTSIRLRFNIFLSIAPFETIHQDPPIVPKYPFVRLLFHPNVRETSVFLPALNTFRRGKVRVLDEQFISMLLEEALLQEPGAGGAQTASVVFNTVFWSEQGDVNTEALKACPNIVILLFEALLRPRLHHLAGEMCPELCDLLDVLLRLESAGKDSPDGSLYTLAGHLQVEESTAKKTQLLELLHGASFHDHVLQACVRIHRELDREVGANCAAGESCKKKHLTALVYGYFTLMMGCAEISPAKNETVTENLFLQTFLRAMPSSFFEVLLAPGAVLRVRLLDFLKNLFGILPEYDEMLSGQNAGHIFVSKQFYQGNFIHIVCFHTHFAMIFT